MASNSALRIFLGVLVLLLVLTMLWLYRGDYTRLRLIAIGLAILSLLVLVTLAWIDKRLSKGFRQSFFQRAGAASGTSIGLLLGVIAALLPLTTRTWSPSTATWVFIVAVVITMLLLVVVRPNSRRRSYLFSWGLLVIIVLGFGFGALLYEARPWWVWLWQKYRFINEPHELLLEALFLLGVILGVFVVRNWGKEDKAFMESLAGVLGGTLIATVIGNAQANLTPIQAIAYYVLGFTISATINLLLAAGLTANYTNKRSVASRALIDFLYGSERSKLIDGYFLKNFEEDPDYAKRLLQSTLLEYRTLVRRQFAEAMQRRMKKRGGTIESPLSPLNTDPPKFFYELFAIECGEQPDPIDSPLSPRDLDREYNVIYKRLDPEKWKITENMFRVSVAMRRQDVLEYIVAPGEFRGSFPYIGSVAGLSLVVRQTIIMDRDLHRQFRSKDYRDGICPRDIQQWRGLDEIDFLSYISIPIVARVGHSNELALGVVNIDTKIFVHNEELDGEPVAGTPNMFRKRLTPNQLKEYASKLYDPEDEDVKYIEKLTKVIEPVLELYSKCRVGAP